MIRSKIDGELLDGFEDDLAEEFFPRAEAAVDRAADRMVIAIQATLSRTGEPRAGAAPAKRTGELRLSIQRKPVRRRASSVSAEYGSDLPQAGRLEFGGKDRRGRYLAPHPYVRPTEEQIGAELQAIMEDL